MSDFEITVPVTDHTDKYVLKQYIGEGEFGEYKVGLSAALPTYSPHVSIGGRTYTVYVDEIVKAIAKKAIANDNLETQ